MTNPDPFLSPDDEARRIARDILATASYASLAVLRVGTLLPSVSRIALATDLEKRPISLVSTLSDHTKAMRANPSCALLIGSPGDKGDPLVHPRLTLHCIATLIPKDVPEHDGLRKHYLTLRPKARLHVDFADFGFVRFQVEDGMLNGGFGKAWRLSSDDLQASQII